MSNSDQGWPLKWHRIYVSRSRAQKAKRVPRRMGAERAMRLGVRLGRALGTRRAEAAGRSRATLCTGLGALGAWVPAQLQLCKIGCVAASRLHAPKLHAVAVRSLHHHVIHPHGASIYWKPGVACQPMKGHVCRPFQYACLTSHAVPTCARMVNPACPWRCCEPHVRNPCRGARVMCDKCNARHMQHVMLYR